MGLKFKAVLFDLDGTLLDTLQDIAEAVNAALASRGDPPHPESAYKRFVGDGVRDLVLRAFSKETLAREGVDACAAAIRGEYEKRWRSNTRPYPGIPELLDELSGRGLPMAVLSNKVDGITKLSVGTFLSRWTFAEVRGAAPGVPLKPDPAAALEIARALGIGAGDFLYLGDTDTDMRTAKAAGMFPVGALWGFRDERELREAGAREVLREPGGLLELLEVTP